MTKVDFLSHNVCFISAFQLASIIMSFYLIAMTDRGKNVFIFIHFFFFNQWKWASINSLSLRQFVVFF